MLAVHALQLVAAGALLQGVAGFPYAAPVRPDAAAYSRCKATHRCNMAAAAYNVSEASFTFSKRVFAGGERQPAELFADFEDWRGGTSGWALDPAYLLAHPAAQPGQHMNALDFASLGELRLGHPCTLVFDTDTGVMSYTSAPVPASGTAWDAYTPSLQGTAVQLPGVTALTPGGGEVVAFAFDSVALSAAVSVRLQGQRPLALLSHSSLAIDTPFDAEAGSLGGFGGAANISHSGAGANENGPGSGSLRVYLESLTVAADNVDEVQTVTVSTNAGQTLRGSFTLSLDGATTAAIPVDASAALLAARLHAALPTAGNVTVSRSHGNAAVGFTWTLTFTTAVGNVPPLTADASGLRSVGAALALDTVVEGNQVDGQYSLQWRGAETAPLQAAATAAEVQAALLAAWVPVGLVSAHVVRSNAVAGRGAACSNGLCGADGPGPAWGVTYTLTLSTHEGNLVFSRPTAAASGASLPPEYPTVASAALTGSGARVALTRGHSPALHTGMLVHPFMDRSPLSLAYGGAGASSGGRGGVGHAVQDPAPAAGSTDVLDLLGGSGGAMGGELPQQALPYLAATGTVGVGGAGGGALQLVAVGDIAIGPAGCVRVSGAAGAPGYRGGGGGAGGTLVMVAGGTITTEGPVTARGGDGGAGVGIASRGGGGGGGGRVALFAQSIAALSGAFVDVLGGVGGADEAQVTGTPSDAADAGPRRLHFNGVTRTPAVARGEDGTLARVSAGGATYAVDYAVGGAEDTQRCLRVAVQERVVTGSGVAVPAPYAHNGPAFTLPANGSGRAWVRTTTTSAALPGVGGAGVDGASNSGSRPARVTVYVRLGAPSAGVSSANWGAHVALHEEDYRNASLPDVHAGGGAPGQAGVGGPAGAGGGGVAGDGGLGGGLGGDATALIGVAVVDGHWRHDANYRHTPGLLAHGADSAHTAQRFVQAERWYKLDVLINWANSTYRVRVDDVTVALDQPFNGTAVRRLGLYTFHGGTAWFDEVYAGPDDTMGFECPVSPAAGAALRMRRPVQSGWAQSDLGLASSLDNETRHEYHVSERERYNNTYNGGLVLGDGDAHEWFVSEVGPHGAAGDRDAAAGDVLMGALTFVPGDSVPAVTRQAAFTTSGGGTWTAGVGAGDGDSSLGNVGGPGARAGEATADGAYGPTRGQVGDGYGRQWNGDSGRWYWYGEHDAVDVDEVYTGAPAHALGGVGACSSNDMTTWRNEGTMFHFANISDDVYGWGVRPDHKRSRVHDMYSEVDATRLSYANALDPFWERDLVHGNDSYSPAALREAQGVIWLPAARMIKRVDGVVFNESAFRNSTVTCSGTVQEHALPRLHDLPVAALCGDDAAAFNATHTAPDLCYFSLAFNHSALGLPPGEVATPVPGGTLVYNTAYWVTTGQLQRGGVGPAVPVNASTPLLVRHFLAHDDGSFTVNGVVGGGAQAPLGPDELRATAGFTYSGGDTLTLQCPRVKRFQYRAERPRVVFNNATREWVMWMHVDDSYQARRLAGVAGSAHPAGPFTFHSSLLPDGNETVDLTLLQPVPGGEAFLARTYYATTAYLLPLPIMQPVWDSVRDAGGMVDFRLNFQRAVYAAGYDNPDDIFRQRWRMEDVPWRVEAGDWLETYDPVAGNFTLANAVTGAVFRYGAGARDATLAMALPDTQTLFSISGQAQAIILSRFVNPDDPANSFWSPGSVPAVKAQPWTENYEDKNVMDNPVHPTVADLLIGPHRKVQYRRAKYVAVSALSRDFRNTSGTLRVLEGQLTGRQDLIAALGVGAGYDVFGWEPGHGGGTTFPGDVTAVGAACFHFDRQADFYGRHHQFSKEFNDRADDFRNFRDRQTSSACPDLHHRAMAKHTECEDILESQVAYVDSPPARTAFDVLDNFARRGDVGTHSFFRAMDSAPYEACLAEHTTLLESYEDCLRAGTPDLNAAPEWETNARDCVGGGGACGPPGPGELPATQYGFNATFTHARQYGSMGNVYGDGGRPFRDAPPARRHAYSRPPATGRFQPAAQDFGAYPRNRPWQ